MPLILNLVIIAPIVGEIVQKTEKLKSEKDLGGTMRLGLYDAILKK